MRVIFESFQYKSHEILFSGRIMDVMKTAAAVLFPDFYLGDKDLHTKVGWCQNIHSGLIDDTVEFI